MGEMVDGVEVGHWTDPAARTGCTVVRLPEGTVASGEIRGGAPATREFGLLAPERFVDRVDAVVLTGGSAFGLAAADGVMQGLEAGGVGFPTAHGIVPIVVGLGLYDLGVGDPSVRPDARAGRAALASAGPTPEDGAVGAGAGATVGKWRGPDHVRPAGVGIVTRSDGPVSVTAIVAVNAVGELDDGEVEAALAAGQEVWPHTAEEPFGNTVIGVVVTNARLTKLDAFVVAQGAHDGLARVVTPPHMRADGDAFVAAATGVVDAPVDQVRLLAVATTGGAIRRAVGSLTAGETGPEKC